MINFFKSFFIISFYLTGQSFAQQSVVNHFTGTLQMGVSLYDLSLEGRKFPIVASYATSGMKVGTTGGFIGCGWNLSAIGSISRVVRDLPDDYLGSSQEMREGWLRGNVAQQVYNFQGDKLIAPQKAVHGMFWRLLNIRIRNQMSLLP